MFRLYLFHIVNLLVNLFIFSLLAYFVVLIITLRFCCLFHRSVSGPGIPFCLVFVFALFPSVFSFLFLNFILGAYFSFMVCILKLINLTLELYLMNLYLEKELYHLILFLKQQHSTIIILSRTVSTFLICPTTK